MRIRILAVTAAVLTSTVASTAACGTSNSHTNTNAAPTPVTVHIEQSSLGSILTDQNGRTLYAFADDKGGKSTCTGDCIATWPALLSGQTVAANNGANQALVSQAPRAEGTSQTTYGEWPLYYYVGDVGPGDVDGQGVDGVWFVVGADGKLIKTETAS
jgi:predicted lipoprotein with Yx(FWY)xxD motif